MCGIAGAYDLAGRRSFPADVLRRMARAIRHRGPDAEGFHFEPGYAAAVQRLILRDREGGMQPMHHGDACLSLNGELFSFEEDRRRLRSSGVEFRTASDTEVFLKGMLAEPAFLERADGQYALALYRREEHSLCLARDPSGIAPLFFALIDGWLLYASEIKALLAASMFPAVLNRTGVDRVLTYLALPPGETCFEKIEALKPGFVLEAAGGRVAQKELPRQPLAFADTSAEALDELLADSVRRRLEADAQVGVYLSGGVDSSLLAALAAQSPARSAELTAYSIRLSQSPRDESIHASALARRLGIRHRILDVTSKEIREGFRDAVFAAEMPVLDHANVCLLLLARCVRDDGRKAVLTGEGADEAFGGYPWQGALLSRLSALLQGPIAAFASASTRKSVRPFKGFNQYALFAGLASVRGLFYTEAFLEEAALAPPPPFALTQSPGDSRLAISLALDREWLLAGHLLLDKGDRVSMAASLEARYPFLDRAVIEFSRDLPDKEKIKGPTNKRILREAALRHLKPEEAFRGKHLFRAAPVIHGPGRPAWVDELLSPESLKQTGLFDPMKVARGLKRRESFSFHPFLESGLSGVVSTQLLYHLFCGPLCDL